MPDWSYQTLFRPILFKLSPSTARDLTLKSFGLLGKLPLGSFIIRTMGHMEMSSELHSEMKGIKIKYPVGLSGGLDIHGEATKSLSQIGFGFIEVGPVTTEEVTNSEPVKRDLSKESIIYPNPYVNDGLENIEKRVNKNNRHDTPLMFRLRPKSNHSPQEAVEELKEMISRLGEEASGFYVDCIDESRTWEDTMRIIEILLPYVQKHHQVKPVFLYIPLDYSLGNLDEALSQLSTNVHIDLDGFVLGDFVRKDTGYEVGYEGKRYSLEKIAKIREWCKEHHLIIASGGVHQPQDALDLMEAGANYILLHTGLVYSGPGLPKRVNEAILYEHIKRTESAKGIQSPRGAESPQLSSFWRDWGWMCLLGVGMMVGGILAWIIAVTVVLLPYDEAFLGIDRATLAQVNPTLLAFMSHDRVTLAGTMISIGILYFYLGKYGLRYRLHWAKTALITSGIIGFSSFFLYLGYGYFDPLHATVAAILLPMFILSMRNPGDKTLAAQPNLFNDRHWYLAQWGQLMFVMLGFALALGGLIISTVGITNVFVHEDLMYLKTTPAEIGEFNQQLIPLIAHDRAGFGGALFSNAIALLATALWGIQQGQRWIWWMFLLGGFPGFVAGFWVHWDIGYTDFIHLLPAYIAILFYIAGLVLLYPYLMKAAQKSSFIRYITFRELTKRGE